MFTDTLRLELQPFGIKVVELRSGMIKSNLINNHQAVKGGLLPEDSIYSPAKEVMDRILQQTNFANQGIEASKWAIDVVSDVLRKNPPPQIWRGESAWIAWLVPKLPFGVFDGALKKAVGMDKAEPLLKR